MKSTIFDNYQITIKLSIKISDKVFKLFDNDDNQYQFKRVDSGDINTVFAHINLNNCSYILLPLTNKHGNYVSKDEQGYYYLAPWYQDELVAARPIRLRFYLNTLSIMHRDFSYQLRVNDGFFKDTYDKIMEQLDDVAKRLDDELGIIERLDYKSPSQWLLLMNNQQFYQALRKARSHLQRFFETSKDETSIRLSLVYQNFDYDHICFRMKKLISSDKMAFAPPIFDIKHLYDASYKMIIDLSGFEQDYLQYFPLNTYEHHWLLALLLIPPIDFAAASELERIIKLTKCLYHIRGGLELERAIESYKRKKDGNRQQDDRN